MTIKLNQPTALRLEQIRAKGFSDEDILAKLKAEDLTAFQNALGEDVDFTSILDFLRANPDDFEKALTDGYELTFISIFGIKNLLAARYNLVAGRDYPDSDESLEDILLTLDGVAWLKSTLSKNFRVLDLEKSAEPGFAFVAVKHATQINGGVL
ncbi:hypothetical protein JJB07_18200 [Tumebacillus sp. ITR2]|uniref:Uncharacterized protein n=1 Tax=Tumebacillus amylolyticus TaxID=2801339 RepID=A0ABS1JE22_9BACL|nr:hypothetical protein [Tumebacillus amylolyticus]MBL0388539.1 hypothetical protein [Tumebacillus amylolyticus]